MHRDVLHHVLPNPSFPEEVNRNFYATLEVALLIDSALRAWVPKSIQMPLSF